MRNGPKDPFAVFDTVSRCSSTESNRWNNFAITSQGIGEALRLSASALSEGGNSLDESIGLITAANEVVQDPSSVGTALKTLTLRLRGAKTELEDASLDAENMAKTTSSLQQKLLGLTGGKVDIMLDKQTFKSTTQILREMASAWEYMTDVQRAGALELMGGKRQANTLSAIISNFDTVESVIQTSESSAGSALEENEKYLDSFDGRLQQFTTAVQTKWNEALDTDLIKDAIQLLTKLVNTLDFSDTGLVDIVHALIQGLSWLTDILGNGNLGYTLIAFFGAKYMQKNGLLDFFGNLKKTGEETIESLTADISKLDDEITNLTEKATKQSGWAQQRTKTDIEIKERLKKQKKTRLEEMKLSKQEQEEIAESFDVVAIKRKNSAYNMNIKKRTAKLKAEGMTPEQIETDPKIQQWTQQVEKGQQAIDQYNQKIKEADMSMQGMNVTTDQSSGKTAVNSTQNVVNAGATQANGEAHQQAGHKTDTHTQDVNENTDALNANTGAATANQVQTQKSGGTWKKAGAALKEFGKSALKTMAYMALLQGAMQILDGIIEGVSWAFSQIFPKEKSFEELNEEFATLSSDLAESKSELSNLESELDDVNSQIREIQALGSLSFTKQEELDNLQKQSAELERQIEMQKILTKNKQGETNDAALAAAKAYMQQSAETEDTLDEAVEQGKETGKKWGSFVDGLLMVGGAITTIATGWTGVGAVVGGAIMAAGMAGVGSKAGEAIGGAINEGVYRNQETNQQAVDNYTKKRQEYQDKMDAAYASSDAEEYSKIQEEYAKYESMMADNIGALLEYTSSTDYDTLTTAQKQQYEAYQRMINLYMKANGGSLTDITDSIFGYDRYEKAGYDIKQIQKQLKNGDINAESAKQQITDLINQTPGLADEFTALGYEVDDVANSYVQLGEAMADDLSLMDSLDKITSVTEAFDELGNAVKEFKEEGIASAGTLASLNDKFGNLDEFEELYKVLATGEGDLESAIKGVANAYVGQAQIMSNMTDEELNIMVSRLKSLGVLNAKEVLMARQKGQQQIDALCLAYSIDLSNYGTAEQAKVAMATAAGLNIADIADDEIKYLADKYKVDLTAYATKEEQKIAIARARAKAEADIDRANAKKEYESGEISYADYQARLTNIDNSLNFDATYNTISSILDAAYKDFQFNLSGNKIGIGSDFDELIEDKATKDAKDAFQKEMDYWENQISANQAKYEQIQNEIDLIEKKGGKAGKEYYEEQSDLEYERLDLLDKQKKAATTYLDTLQEGSDEWWEAANTLNDIEGEIDDVTSSIQDLNDAIAEIDLYIFEETHNRFQNLIDDLETIRDLIAQNGEEDWFDDEGMWTEKGVAVLGTYIQQYEMYQEALAKVNEELAKYQKEEYQKEYTGNEEYYKNLGINSEQELYEKQRELKPYAGNEEYYAQLGIDSEQELYDKTQELIDQQYSYAQAINDTENSVKDAYNAQIDAIEGWADEAIDAYNDYISVVRESLDAERDLYEFKKSTNEKTKNIASLERRIASLSASDNASDVAERRKLQAELADAKMDLEDHYYDHAKDQQSQALDDEAQAYEESLNNYIEKLRDTLDEATSNMELFMESVTNSVMINAETVKNEYVNTGVVLDEALVSPWNKAIEQMKGFEKDGLSMMNAWTTEEGFFGKFKTNATNQLKSPWSAGTNAANAFKNDVKIAMENVVSTVKSNVADAKKELSSLYEDIQDTDVGGSGNGGNGGNGDNDDNDKKSMHRSGVAGSDFTEHALGLNSQGLGNEVVTIDGVKYLKRVKKNSKTGKVTTLYHKLSDLKTINSSGVTYYHGTSKTPNYLYYAKGTTGTKKDQWAVTDESWIGEEITLAAGKNGQLQYLKKGSAVMPADISANLIEWGKLNPNMMNMPNAGGGVNIVSNAINKPELNLSFDSLVHVDNCSQDTLKDLEKMVDTKINQFSRNLNYALKRL